MVYIASPLHGDYNTNIKNAVEYCRLAGEQGVLPIAPHIIFSQWCNDTIPEQREQGCWKNPMSYGSWEPHSVKECKAR